MSNQTKVMGTVVVSLGNGHDSHCKKTFLCFMIHVCLVVEDESFEADKAQVVREIVSLKP